MIAADGRHVPPTALTVALWPIQTIEASQIVQEIPSEISVRIVRRPGYSMEDEAKLMAP